MPTASLLDPHHPRFAGRARLWRPMRGNRRIDLPERSPLEDDPTLAFTKDSKTAYLRRLQDVRVQDLLESRPMRDFARRHGQGNKPLAKWTHTTGHLVPAESRHERSLILIADHHPAFTHISSQPFTIEWPTGSEFKTHTPDFVLLSAERPPLVVDVKTAHAAADESIVRLHAEVGRVLFEAGMSHVVWTGMPRRAISNLSNFSGARVPVASYERWARVVAELADEPLLATELADAVHLAGYPREHALMLIRRMLWRRSLLTDLSVNYGLQSLVWAP